jgi:hypothetical protein
MHEEYVENKVPFKKLKTKWANSRKLCTKNPSDKPEIKDPFQKSGD